MNTTRKLDRRRIVFAVLAVIFAVIAAVLWFAAQRLVEVDSPLNPHERIVDRLWDTRLLACAVLAFNTALIAAVFAAAPRAQRAPNGERQQS